MRDVMCFKSGDQIIRMYFGDNYSQTQEYCHYILGSLLKILLA